MGFVKKWPADSAGNSGLPEIRLADRSAPRTAEIGKFGTIPVLDQAPGDRGRRRHHELPRLEGGQQLRPADPARLADLVAIDPDALAAVRRGPKAQHQAARHRPWLAAEVLDLAD